MISQANARRAFGLTSIIYDSRYRSYLIQAVVLFGFVALVLWLGYNAEANLAAKGRTFDFGFLWRRAGYDIGQTLIPFTNDDSHFRALLVGLLNTLVLAFASCVLATILGVMIGVLRLSKNWLINRLMAIYIELFRNVPLLLWIVLTYVILIEFSPQPGAYKVTDEMVAASWHALKSEHLQSGKTQKDWRSHYRNAVRKNWLKLWYIGQDRTIVLTTAGHQALREMAAQTRRAA